MSQVKTLKELELRILVLEERLEETQDKAVESITRLWDHHNELRRAFCTFRSWVVWALIVNSIMLFILFIKTL